MKLERRYVEKPWGITKLPQMFDSSSGRRIGEVWFSGSDCHPLLVKFLFTNEPLSVQVHPTDEYAHRRQLPSGKTECWYVLHAEPHAKVALGLKSDISKEELRAAVCDGSLESLVSWRGVTPGDFFLVPAGMIHAIGAGISLIEFQQNVDVTYRLYDFGRERQLHLEDALCVALRDRYPDEFAMHAEPETQQVLTSGPPIMLIQSNRDAFRDRLRWITPLTGYACCGGERAMPGDCLLVQPRDKADFDGWALIATMV